MTTWNLVSRPSPMLGGPGKEQETPTEEFVRILSQAAPTHRNREVALQAVRAILTRLAERSQTSPAVLARLLGQTAEELRDIARTLDAATTLPTIDAFRDIVWPTEVTIGQLATWVRTHDPLAVVSTEFFPTTRDPVLVVTSTKVEPPRRFHGYLVLRRDAEGGPLQYCNGIISALRGAERS